MGLSWFVCFIWETLMWIWMSYIRVCAKHSCKSTLPASPCVSLVIFAALMRSIAEPNRPDHTSFSFVVRSLMPIYFQRFSTQRLGRAHLVVPAPPLPRLLAGGHDHLSPVTCRHSKAPMRALSLAWRRLSLFLVPIPSTTHAQPLSLRASKLALSGNFFYLLISHTSQTSENDFP